MKLAIITPIYSSYPQTWVNSTMNCIVEGSANDLFFSMISPAGCSNVTSARNLCMQEVYIHEQNVKSKFDYLLFVDSDITFTLQNIKQLLEQKKDVIAGIYFSKAKPFFPVAGYYDLNKVLNGFPKLSKQEILSKKVLEVDWVGCGFLLMKREVLEKIEYPWFEMRTIDLPKLSERSGGFKIKKEILSEDITFCTKIKELGYKIFVDTSVLLPHLGNKDFTIDHFLAVQE